MLSVSYAGKNAYSAGKTRGCALGANRGYVLAHCAPPPYMQFKIIWPILNIYTTQSAENHMGKLVAQFLLLIQLYTLFKVSPGYAFKAISFYLPFTVTWTCFCSVLTVLSNN